MKKNLRHHFNNAENYQGLHWYRDAFRFSKKLAKETGYPLRVVVGVLSALSPSNKWERNKYDTIQVLKAVRDGKSPDDVKVCTYGANKHKAFAIAFGDAKILKQSPKTYAFARNVGELDGDFVTIDKWHLRACQTSSLKSKQCRESVTPHQYKVLSQETIKVAAEYGVPAYVFQAIIWVTIRNRWN